MIQKVAVKKRKRYKWGTKNIWPNFMAEDIQVVMVTGGFFSPLKIGKY